MKSYPRSVRVGELIQRVLSETLRRDTEDPRLTMTTISAVKMTPDLKIARVYYTTPGDEQSRQAAAEGFSKAAGFLKRSLARQINLRYMPDLEFYFDNSLDYGFHIDKLLSAIKEENGSDNTTVEEK